MADRNVSPPIEGETRVGSTTPGVRGVLHVSSPLPSKGAVIALDAVAANGAITTVYLWMDTTGALRSATALPADTEGDGTTVSSQAAAGGSTTQVQYNNAGALGGITGATSNGTALTLVAPVLGTPASGTLTNCTGLPVSTGVSGLGTGVASYLGQTAPFIKEAFVVKAVDQSKTVNTTLADDDTLVYALAANEVAKFKAVLFVDGDSGTADIKVALNAPASATGRYAMTGNTSAVTTTSAVQSTGGTAVNGSGPVAFGTTTSFTNPIVIEGIIRNDATPGNLAIQWAQNTSDAGATTVRANSFLHVQRIS